MRVRLRLRTRECVRDMREVKGKGKKGMRRVRKVVKKMYVCKEEILQKIKEKKKKNFTSSTFSQVCSFGCAIIRRDK